MKANKCVMCGDAPLIKIYPMIEVFNSDILYSAIDIICKCGRCCSSEIKYDKRIIEQSKPNELKDYIKNKRDLASYDLIDYWNNKYNIKEK